MTLSQYEREHDSSIELFERISEAKYDDLEERLQNIADDLEEVIGEFYFNGGVFDLVYSTRKEFTEMVIKTLKGML